MKYCGKPFKINLHWGKKCHVVDNLRETFSIKT
jgi:hypothetical protein